MREEKGMQGGRSFLELLLNILVFPLVALPRMLLGAWHCPLPEGECGVLASPLGFHLSLLMGSLTFPE